MKRQSERAAGKGGRLEVVAGVLKGLIAAAGVVMLALWMTDGATWYKPMSYLVTIVLPFVPDILRRCQVRVSTPLVIAYEVFIMVAMIGGIDLDWYKLVMVTAEGDSYFDKIVHGLSGVLVVFAGRELLMADQKRRGGRRGAVWFEMLFMMGLTMLVAVGWECFEFFYDLICGGHMQELVKSGVADTMWDLVYTLGFGVVAAGVVVRMESRA